MKHAFFLLPLALILPSACKDKVDDKTPEAALDDGALNKAEIDPALTSALEAQIMVDPALTGDANREAIKAADAPAQALIPPDKSLSAAAAVRTNGPTLGELADQQAQKKTMAGCNSTVSYGLRWSTTLPADIPIYPRGKVMEAAGSDRAACRLRIVTFATEAPPRAVIDYYLGAARRSGYQAGEEQDGKTTLVGGTRKDGAAFTTMIMPAAGGGAAVDLIVNNGL